MNPELPQVRPSVEAMPQIPGGAEYFPDGTVKTPETAPERERQPGPAEQAPQSVVAPPIQTQQVAVPQVPAPVATPASDMVSDAPIIAADDDLMEKEWVDKVKKIIVLTKGNPYEQAKAIATLQADYLKKRYDRTIGESEAQQT